MRAEGLALFVSNFARATYPWSAFGLTPFALSGHLPQTRFARGGGNDSLRSRGRKKKSLRSSGRTRLRPLGSPWSSWGFNCECSDRTLTMALEVDGYPVSQPGRVGSTPTRAKELLYRVRLHPIDSRLRNRDYLLVLTEEAPSGASSTSCA